MTEDESDFSPTTFETKTDDTPYENTDVSALPEWWREAIEEFQNHGLRPFRPPQFSDGELKFRTVERLENELNVDIDFVGIRVSHGDDWAVRVDDNIVGTISRQRTSEAYSQFGMPSDEFDKWIRDYIAERD